MKLPPTLQFLTEVFGAGPLIVVLSLAAGVGFAAHSLQMAPPAEQRLPIETRFR